MRAIRTYQPWLAAILIVVYACVACVQLRHHHPNGIANAEYRITTSTGRTVPDLFVDGPTSPGEADCPVCSHQFLTYKSYTTLPLKMPVVIFAARNGYYRLPSAASPSFPLPTPGPPCAASVSFSRS